LEYVIGEMGVLRSDFFFQFPPVNFDFPLFLPCRGKKLILGIFLKIEKGGML